MNKDLIVHVNEHMQYMEEIFNRYITLDGEDTFMFIRGERFPIVKKYKYDLTNNPFGITSTPYFPYKSAGCFCRMLKFLMYRESCLIEDHHDINPYVRNPVDVFPDFDNDLTGIILEYIPNITVADRDSLINIILDYKTRYAGTLQYLLDHILDFDVSGEFLVIKDLGDILSFRYKELLNTSRKGLKRC